MMNIPSSWTIGKFDELNEFKSAIINPDKFSSEKFDLYSVPIFPLGQPEKLIGREIGSTKQLVEPNDVLISKINPRINRVWKIAEKKCLRQIASSEWIVFRNKYLESRYFLYYFRSPLFREKLCADVTGVGGSLTRAQPKKVAEFLLPVAPLAEQSHIADKLDTTLARVDALNDRLARITPLLKRFRQSVLAAATSGRLTEDWRNSHASIQWQNKKLSDFCKITSGFAFKSTDFVESGVIAVKISNIQYGEFEIKNQEYLPASYAEEYDKFIVSSGDLLLALTRPITNGQLKVCKFPSAIGQGLLNQRVCKIACDDEILNKYLHIYMQSDRFLNLVSDGLTETLQPNLSPKDLAEFKIQIPTGEEQTEIVHRVETLFAFADRIEARLQSAQTAADRLTPALLAKAFRGELVPQDPNDEPATELLRRLREARATEAPAKPKRGRKAAAA